MHIKPFRFDSFRCYITTFAFPGFQHSSNSLVLEFSALSASLHGIATRTETIMAEEDASDSLVEKLRTVFLECCEPPQCLTATSSLESLPVRNLWTLKVDCMKLLASCPELSHTLFFQTISLMGTLRQVCAEFCASAGRCLSAGDVSIRLVHLPTVGAPPPSLPPPQGVLVSVCGTIVRMNAKRVVPFVRRLGCPKCNETVELSSNPFDRAAKAKERCARKECKGEELQQRSNVLMDYGECRLQQRSSHTGRLPRTLLVTLEDELTQQCNVGQLVEVVGILFPKWRSVYPQKCPIIEPTVWALSVNAMEPYREGGAGSSSTVLKRRPIGTGGGSSFTPELFFSQFSKDKLSRCTALVTSICSHLSGLFAPRMAILLALVGGTSTTGKSNMHVRSTIHCLFVGDPSTGKSQLLRSAAQLAPRSTSTTGIGSTSAGLTVAASKEGGEWVLEPGALALSDGGVCVIDELRTVSATDRASLHEAMEQQTISVAKAGMVTRLRTCCSVISACNPPANRRNGAEIGVGGPLLSRFDFLFLLYDTPCPEVDERIATHILSSSQVGQHQSPVLSQDDVARYLRWVHAHYAQKEGPLLSDEAAELIKTYYEMQQRRGTLSSLADSVPVTIRLLESLVRITQAYAKLNLEHVCTEEDAALTIFLMEQSAYGLKCPLEALGPDVYTSSKCLEESFMDISPSGVRRQRFILQSIINVFSSVRCSIYSNPSEERPPNDAVADSWLEALKAPKDSPSKPSNKRSRVETGSSNMEAALRSAKRLAFDVSTPAPREQTVIYYPNLTPTNRPTLALLTSPSPPTPSQRLRDAEEIMRSLAFHF
ncbi:putative DNA replication factor [Trypanosoma vivax]|nr:putative DNA replication factor [Trypanosoma vivax]